MRIHCLGFQNGDANKNDNIVDAQKCDMQIYSGVIKSVNDVKDKC